MDGEEPVPRRMSRAEAKEQTRRRLLTAAAKVVARHGFAGASVDDIAATAGYTVGALYAQFESKEKLLVEAMHTHVTERVAWLRSVIDAGSFDSSETKSALAKILSGATESSDSAAPLFWAELWLYAARNPELADILAGHARAVDESIVRSIQTRRAANGDATSAPEDISDEALATVVSSLFRGLSQRRRIDPESVPEHLLGQALQLLVAGRQALRGGRTEGG